MTVIGGALRSLLGAALAWPVAIAMSAPEIPIGWRAAAIVVLLTTIWRPRWGILLVLALAPAAALVVPQPGRGVELLAWAFLAPWLLCLWRPLSDTGWPRAIAVPALLYGGALLMSWLRIAIAGAAGVPVLAMPLHLFHAIPVDHLVFSSPEPETWTLLQSLTGLGIFLAMVGITETEKTRTTFGRALAHTVVLSIAVLAGATLIYVGRQWAESGYASGFLLRYVRGERFSLLPDVNAAGSLYVLAMVTAATLALADRERKHRWIAALALLLPALWFTGSRSSYAASVVGLGLLGIIRGPWQPLPATRKTAAAVVFVVLLSAALTADWQSQGQGSVGTSINLRAQFSQATARMFASSPVFGVGIGRYFDRSPDFLSEELRDIYGNENAHNYFAQQFAELGLGGGLLFIWLVAAGLAAAWRAVHRGAAGIPQIALLAGTAGYVATCITGHPLLVPEAALPFWIVFGALAGQEAVTDPRLAGLPRGLTSAAGGLIVAWLVWGLAAAGAAYARVTEPPPEQGFHGVESVAGERPFRWMTRHAVTYVPNEPGFVRLRLRSPDRPFRRPLLLETFIAGRRADRRELASGARAEFGIPVRPRESSAAFLRVDFRVNQQWMEEVQLGNRRAQRPITVMVQELVWIPLR